MKRFILFLTFAITFMVMKQSAAQTSPGKKAAVLNHIAVYVNNLDKSAAFYENLFN